MGMHPQTQPGQPGHMITLSQPMVIIQRAIHLVATAVLSVIAMLPTGVAPANMAPAAPNDVNLTIDGAQTFQRIDGLGVNANGRRWNNGQLAPAVDMLGDQ